MKEYYTSGGLSRKSNSMQNLLRLSKAGKDFPEVACLSGSLGHLQRYDGLEVQD